MSHALSSHGESKSVTFDANSHAIAVDTVDSLFDLYRCILPAQVRKLRRESPELNLLVALMVHAINEYLGLEGPTATKERAILQRAAELWLDGEPGAPLPFRRCCDLLGIDPDAARSAIKRLATSISE